MLFKILIFLPNKLDYLLYRIIKLFNKDYRRWTEVTYWGTPKIVGDKKDRK